MKIQRAFALAGIVLLSVLTTSEATAKKAAAPADNGSPANSGYPPGPPWEAISADFQTTFTKIDAVKQDTTAATYCGDSSCTTGGPGGLYQLRLGTSTTWAPGEYAGSLTVSLGVGPHSAQPATLAQGTTLVTFDVSATP